MWPKTCKTQFEGQTLFLDSCLRKEEWNANNVIQKYGFDFCLTFPTFAFKLFNIF